MCTELQVGDSVKILKSGYPDGTPVDQMIGKTFVIDDVFPITMGGVDQPMFVIGGWHFVQSEIERA